MFDAGPYEFGLFGLQRGGGGFGDGSALGSARVSGGEGGRRVRRCVGRGGAGGGLRGAQLRFRLYLLAQVEFETTI